MRRIFPLAVFAGLTSGAALPAQTSRADSAAVVAVVQRLFDAMEAGDTATIRSLLIPGMEFVSKSVEQPTSAPRFSPDSSFARNFAGRTQKLVERMWSPVVQVQGPIAIFWAPYDFHIDGKFSHCGIDTGVLMQTSKGWQFANLSYTTQRTNCPPSPLGPPR